MTPPPCCQFFGGNRPYLKGIFFCYFSKQHISKHRHWKLGAKNPCENIRLCTIAYTSFDAKRVRAAKCAAAARRCASRQGVAQRRAQIFLSLPKRWGQRHRRCSSATQLQFCLWAVREWISLCNNSEFYLVLVLPWKIIYRAVNSELVLLVSSAWHQV